jgi:predicted transcriptional regulator
VEAKTTVSAPDFEKMSKAEIVTWFSTAPESSVVEVLRAAHEVDDPPAATRPDDGSIPLMLTSIRLPVELVRSLDAVAAVEGVNRSEAIRLAIAEFVRQRTGEVSPSEAERALDVIRRVVGEHVNSRRDAA